MIYIARDNIQKKYLPGRTLQNAVGRDSAIASEKMTVCFAHYSEESGPMQPHNHAEETVVVLDAKDTYVLYGSAEDNLEYRADLKPGDICLFKELEWHVFRYEEGGHLDLLCIYGQVDNIRPEQIANR